MTVAPQSTREIRHSHRRRLYKARRGFEIPESHFCPQTPTTQPQHHFITLSNNVWTRKRRKGGPHPNHVLFIGLFSHRLFFDRDSERVEPSVTARFFVITSRVSHFWFRHTRDSLADLLFRYHQTRHPSSRSSWRCEAYLRSHLRRDSWCSENFPRKRALLSSCHRWILGLIYFLFCLRSFATL